MSIKALNVMIENQLLSRRKSTSFQSNYTAIVAFFLICIILSGCKNSTGSKHQDGTELPSDQLVIELNAKVSQDDLFELFYKRQNEVYNDQDKVNAEVKGSDSVQKVRFILKKGEFPSHIRLDLGQNDKQGSIQIVELNLRYNEGIKRFTKEEIVRYFRPNNYVTMNSETIEIQLETKNNRYDPYLESNNLSKFVNKLILY